MGAFLNVKMEPIVTLAAQYRQEFDTVVGNLHQQSLTMNDDLQRNLQQMQEMIPAMQSRVLHIKHELIATVQDANALVIGQGQLLLETYAWSTVMLIAVAIAQIASVYAFSSIVALFIEPLFAMTLIYGLLPVFAHIYINSTPETSQNDRHIEMFLLSLVFGTLFGQLLNEDTLLVNTPPPYIHPAVVALLAVPLQVHLGQNRRNYLLACVGTATAIDIIIGMVFGILGVDYLIITCLYSIGTMVHAQLLISTENDETKKTLYQLYYTIGMLAIQGLMRSIFALG